MLTDKIRKVGFPSWNVIQTRSQIKSKTSQKHKVTNTTKTGKHDPKKGKMKVQKRSPMHREVNIHRKRHSVAQMKEATPHK